PTAYAFTDEAHYRTIIEKIVSGVGRRLDESSPMVDARLPDGSRVNAILPPLAIHAPVLTIRKFAADPYEARDLVNFGTYTLDLTVLLEACVRGAEALDMLQAINTGHEGSMTTIHANSPRDALSRLETMVLMAGFELPVRAIREQIASAINVIIQLDRAADGRRVVTEVTEIQGLEGETILLQDLFAYRSRPGADGKPLGELVSTG